MNAVGLVVSALAVAGVSFGAGRVTANASSTATATANPAICNQNDALAEMMKKQAADREASHQRDIDAAKQAQDIKVSKISPSTMN